ncbi:hypothetical protein PVBG_05893, partial [Plasmodium vivax Brazil I]
MIQALSFPLPLDDFYYDLNHSKKNLNKYNEECKRLCSKNESFTDIRLCSILLRFLNNSSTRTNNINSDYDDCILFNYWIYDKLEQKYKNDYYKKFVPIYGDLQAMWNSLIEKPSKNPYYDKCKPDNTIVNQNDWKQRKELYDYCVNYELIQKQMQFYENKCEQFYAYIKSHAPLYKQFKTLYSSENRNKWPEIYSKCEGYHPDTVLPLLDCHKDIKEEELSLAVKVPSKESPQYIPPRDTFSPDDLRLKNASSPPLTKAGDVLLGVVATAMTSGALYK